jgi:uncharacterized protein YaiL (DUF2058 family)
MFDMAKLNPLQQQLLKAGLVKKSKAAEVAREQHLAHHAKAAHTQTDAQREAERARADKAEHDRALETERKAQARTRELHAQARQIIEDKQVAQAGEQDYRFEAGGAIRSLRVDDALRKQLASGALVIAQSGERYALLPRAAASKVRERAPEHIVLDHGQATNDAAASTTSEDDAYYAQFTVPDDLMW